ncbi:MAG TPA: 3'-5' exonuclease [Gemmatimonadaceae bacterium]|nr:3'-5' exonuclease [Gemmatimonadaceae bacterium]
MSEYSSGITVEARDTLLTLRAVDYLAAGPADAKTLISHVCQLPTMPVAVAEHMARALFAGHRRFVCEPDGRWGLARDLELSSSESLAGLSYAIVDVEATGSRLAGGDRITEIAVVEVKNGVAKTLVDTLVNPERAIPSWISGLTNISAQMVRHAPVFSEICDQLLGALDGRVFVAHNVNFDWRFLNVELERATGRTLAGRRLCTVKLVKKLLPQLRRRSLDYVAMHYDVEITRRHRAGGDAEATARVFLRLLDDARRDGCATWDDLQRLLIRPIPKRHRRRRPTAFPRPVDKDTTA